MPKSTNFAALMEDNYNPIKRINLFRQASREEKFAYLFDKNQLPTIGAWYVSGEILIWVLWISWITASLCAAFSGGFLVNGFRGSVFFVSGTTKEFYGVETILEVLLIVCVGSLLLCVVIAVARIFVPYFYPLLSLPIWLAKKSKEISTFWIVLFLWAVFCLVMSIWIGKPDSVRVADSEGIKEVASTWIDWLIPEKNDLILAIGYPVFLFILAGAFTINIFYYKYKPQIDSDKNWSAEGLDSHLLDGDADN